MPLVDADSGRHGLQARSLRRQQSLRKPVQNITLLLFEQLGIQNKAESWCPAMATSRRNAEHLALVRAETAFQPATSLLFHSEIPRAAKWCGNSQSGRASILLTNEET